MNRGGHFAAHEDLALLAAAITAFFRDLRSALPPSRGGMRLQGLRWRRLLRDVRAVSMGRTGCHILPCTSYAGEEAAAATTPGPGTCPLLRPRVCRWRFQP